MRLWRSLGAGLSDRGATGDTYRLRENERSFSYLKSVRGSSSAGWQAAQGATAVRRDCDRVSVVRAVTVRSKYVQIGPPVRRRASRHVPLASVSTKSWRRCVRSNVERLAPLRA